MALYVEILHDQASQSLSTEPLHLGLQLLQPLVGELLIVKESRSIKIADETENSVLVDKIRSWPAFSANVTLVLTDRLLLSECGDVASAVENGGRIGTGLKRLTGVAFTNHDVAIVSSANFAGEVGVAKTVAHETAHLFNIGKGQTNADGHCDDELCIMSPVSTGVTSSIEIDRRTKRNRLKAAIGMPKLTLKETPIYSKFCAGCEVKLLKRAPALQHEYGMRTLQNFSKHK